MPTTRIALASVRYPSSPDESIEIAQQAIARAGAERADIVCFPEAFVPGYRGLGFAPPAPDRAFHDRALSAIASSAARARVAVVLGRERIVDDHLRISVAVIGADGEIVGHQDKVQLDPSEEGTYGAATERRVFTTGGATFGVSICHEGWRYPETVRWAVRQGAQIVFHPHFAPREPGAFQPTRFGDAANSFHETSLRARAAENTCYYASVNYATPGSPTTSTVVAPDGTVIAYQPYGDEGVLIADLDLALATGYLAKRYKPV